MNLTALQTALKRYGFDDSDPLNTWINAALHEIEKAAEWPFLIATFSETLAVGDNTLTVPADFVKPIFLRNATDGSLLTHWDVRFSARELYSDEYDDQGDPYAYTWVNNELTVWPVPNKATSITGRYMKSLTELSSGANVPGIPERDHYTIVRGAAMIALQAENEEERAVVAQNQFEADIGKMIEFYSVTHLGESDTIADAMGYSVE